MTGLQIYALYGAPLVLLGAGVGVYYLTGWLDRRERHKRHGVR